MKTNYKSLTAIFVIVLSLWTSLTCKKEQTESSVLTAQTVLGDVTVQSEDKISTPAAGSAIKENSIIKTGKLSLIDIKYKNSGIIRINENSNINIDRLFSSGTADEIILQMEEGKVFVTVSKLMKDSKFQVKTPTSVAGVRGTAFRVSSEKGVSRVDVLAGRVKVNPVKDNIVVENIEKIVEPEKAVEIDQKDIIKIVEENKEIEIVSLQKEEIQAIKEEAKFVKLDESFNEEIKNEIKEIGIESKPVEIKDNREYEKELFKQMIKMQEEREAAIKEQEAIKAREEAEKKEKESKEKAAKEKEARKKEERANKEKARLEKIEKEKQIKEMARQKEIEKEEKQKEEKRKEKQKQEERVKNIPNF